MFDLRNLGLPGWAYGLVGVIQVLVLIHAVRNGRISPWLYIIMFIPFLGTLAYIVVELIPEFQLPALPQRSLPLSRLKEQAAEFPTADNFETLGNAYEKEGNFEEALVWYKRSAEGLHADDAYLRRNIARIQLQLHQPAQALDEMEAIASIEGETAEDYLLRGRILAALSKIEEARHFFDLAVKRHTSLVADYYFALFLKDIGDEEAFNQVLQNSEKKVKDYLPKYRKQEQVWVNKIKQL